jgi:hypothetical protein
MTEIEVSWTWDDDGSLGKFELKCPHCGSWTKEETISINDEIITCYICKTQFVVKRKTWAEIVKTE